ncbi:hypothetical protein HNP84_009334 [Thermocatellispora tengchongensis]|uniref:Uncharacterized protein n=1 Tax=Thermocatellispora tengchongensis TaxID=1073253 RepID=A0A840PP61_9ACTN|nr:hypothetical protein [Thermocatellispora tengchongensis]MBB5139571.1 hypothetical protein [Thermocatellispora tengchongensis]
MIEADLRGRVRFGRSGVRFSEGQERLAADPQMLGLLAEFTEPRGQGVDVGLGLLDLAGQGLLAGIQPVQEPGSGIGRAGIGPGHVHRQDGVEGVRRRDITSVIAQYTRDSELDGRCS